MIINIVLLSLISVSVNARATDVFDQFNVVTAPPNCPIGQEWINGQCRDVWKSIAQNEDVNNKNVIEVPPNCLTGQQWINGECRDVWRNNFETQNVITVPPNCPNGQEYINGQCRDVWLKNTGVFEETENSDSKNDIVVPPNCLTGQQWINGECRDVWRNNFETQNVITVPPNCPDGQEYINGECRDVWLKNTEVFEETKASDYESILLNKIADWFRTTEINAITDSKSVISVPTQCPSGYVPDAHGVCRPIW